MNSEKKHPKIAVILAVYNGEKWIEEQIKSILNQKNVNISIFISIDPSSDRSEDICFDLQKRHTQIILLPIDQKFGAAAPNFFRLIRDVDITSFNYLAFADQDDIWHLDKLLNATEMLKKKDCAGYSSNVSAFWLDGREKLINKSQMQVKWDYLFESAGPGCTYVIDIKLALKLQEFVHTNQADISNIWAHDWFIYAFARAQNYKWYIDKHPSMLYRQHDSNQVGVNTGYSALLHRARFVLNNKALSQSSLIATLCGLEKHPFIKKWNNNSRLGMLYLTLNATKCRRKRLDQVFFFLSCVLLIFVGKR